MSLVESNKEGGQVALPQKNVPHYALPNQSHSLSTYSNTEADVVRQSFSPASFRMLSHLPNDLRPQQILDANSQHADYNLQHLLAAPMGSYKKVDKVFLDFEYMSSPYSLADELKKKERIESTEKRMTVSEREFTYSSARPQPVGPLQGRPSPEEEVQYVNPYEEAHNAQLREKWLQQSKILHGPFKVNVEKSVGNNNPSLLPDIIQKLMRQIQADWSETHCEIYCDADDIIILEFDSSTVDNPKGLQAYMNMLTKSSPIISEHILSKVVELWSHTADSHIYYAYKPPWVHRAATEPYYILHPDQRKFRLTKQANENALHS